MEVLTHAPYSPDLAPSDYQLLLALKGWLGGIWFTNDGELQNGILQWMKKLHGKFYRDGISKLIKRYEKCIAINGAYVGK